MYDTVRWVLLIALFAGLFGVWYWSRRQAMGQKIAGQALNSKFTILQKRWLDKGTGVCLVEAEDKHFLLAYTAGGGVSWQPVEKAKPKAPPEKNGKRVACIGVVRRVTAELVIAGLAIA